MKNKHLGYVTSDPKNLGTALKISVRVKLPKLSKDSRLQTLLKILKLNQSYRVVDDFEKMNDFDLDEEDRDASIIEISSMQSLGKTEVKHHGLLLLVKKLLIKQQNLTD